MVQNLKLKRQELLSENVLQEIKNVLRTVAESLHERDAPESFAPIWDNRQFYPRFGELFGDGELFPIDVFTAMMNFEEIDGSAANDELLHFRDSLTVSAHAIKEIVNKVSRWNYQQSRSQDPRSADESDDFTVKGRFLHYREFKVIWQQFEALWLQEKESEAIASLQPEIESVIALKKLLDMKDKESMYAHPAIVKHRQNTVNGLGAFLSCIKRQVASKVKTNLSYMPPSADHFVLFEYIYSNSPQTADEAKEHFLHGLSQDMQTKFYSGDNKVPLKEYAKKIMNCRNATRYSKAVMLALDDLKSALLEVVSHLPAMHHSDENLISYFDDFNTQYQRAAKTLIEPYNLI